jgi:hypothetical protein
MSQRNLSNKKDIKEEDFEEEREPLFSDSSKWQQKPNPVQGGVIGKCCFIMWRLHRAFFCLFFLFLLFVFVIGSFRLSNVEEIFLHPSSFPDYVDHFLNSMNAIGQDLTLFDSIKAARPKTFSKQEKARLNGINNPNHLVWGSMGEGKQSCVKVNETYLLMVLNTPSAITANMESFLKMSTEPNHFIVSHTFDFLPSHPKSVKEITAKEKTMTSYFRFDIIVLNYYNALLVLTL